MEAVKKLLHKVLAIVVSVCMVCTLTPSLAFATDNQGTTQKAPFIGEDFTLEANGSTFGDNDSVGTEVTGITFKGMHVWMSLNNLMFRDVNDLLQGLGEGGADKIYANVANFAPKFDLEWKVREIRLTNVVEYGEYSSLRTTTYEAGKTPLQGSDEIIQEGGEYPFYFGGTQEDIDLFEASDAFKNRTGTSPSFEFTISITPYDGNGDPLDVIEDSILVGTSGLSGPAIFDKYGLVVGTTVVWNYSEALQKWIQDFLEKNPDLVPGGTRSASALADGDDASDTGSNIEYINGIPVFRPINQDGTTQNDFVFNEEFNFACNVDYFTFGPIEVKQEFHLDNAQLGASSAKFSELAEWAGGDNKIIGDVAYQFNLSYKTDPTVFRDIYPNQPYYIYQSYTSLGETFPVNWNYGVVRIPVNEALLNEGATSVDVYWQLAGAEEIKTIKDCPLQYLYVGTKEQSKPVLTAFVPLDEYPLNAYPESVADITTALGSFAISYTPKNSDGTPDNNPDKVTVDSTSTGVGSISPSGTHEYIVGTMPEYIVDPAADGYELKEVIVTVDGQRVPVVNVGEGSPHPTSPSIQGNVVTLPILDDYVGKDVKIEAVFGEVDPDDIKPTNPGEDPTRTGVNLNLQVRFEGAEGTDGVQFDNNIVYAEFTRLPVSDNAADNRIQVDYASQSAGPVKADPLKSVTVGTDLLCDRENVWKGTWGVDSITVNGVPMELAGDELYLASLKGDTTIVVTLQYGTITEEFQPINWEATPSPDSEGKYESIEPSGPQTTVSGGPISVVGTPKVDSTITNAVTGIYIETPNGDKTYIYGGPDDVKGTGVVTIEPTGAAKVELDHVISDMNVVFEFDTTSTYVTISKETTDGTGYAGGTVQPAGPQKLENDGDGFVATITPNSGYTLGPITIDDNSDSTEPITINPSDLYPEGTAPTRNDGTPYYPFVVIKADDKDLGEIPTDNNGNPILFVQDSNGNWVPSTTPGEGLPAIYVSGPAADMGVEFTPVAKPSAYAIIETVVNGGHGTITPTTSVELSSTADNGTKYAPGPVDIYFFPDTDPNYKIRSITITPDRDASGNNAFKPISYTLDALNSAAAPKVTLEEITTNIKVEVTYELGDSASNNTDRYEITVHPATNGTISPSGKSPDYKVPVYKGEDATFQLLPDPGYKLGDVYVTLDGVPVKVTDDVVTNPDGSKTITIPAKDIEDANGKVEISASFIKDGTSVSGMHTVTIIDVDGVTVSPVGTLVVADGADLPILILPEKPGDGVKVYVDKGDGFKDVTNEIDENGVLTLHGIASDQTVNFVLVPKDDVDKWDDPDNPTKDDYPEPNNPDIPPFAPDNPDNEDPNKKDNTFTIPPENFDVGEGAILSPGGSGLTLVAEPNSDPKHSDRDVDFTVVIIDGYEFDEPGVTYKDADGNTVTLTPDNGLEKTGDGVYKFTVPAKDLTEDFKMKVPTKKPAASTEDATTGVIHIEVEGQGRVTPCDENNTTRVKLGASQTFNFIPNPADEASPNGYKVISVTVDGQEVEFEGNTYTLHNVKTSNTIHVVFGPVGADDEPATPDVTHTVKLPSNDDLEHGSIYPEGEVEVIEGSDLTITTTPDEGYKPHVVVKDPATGEVVEIPVQGNTAVIPNITGDKEVEVTFTPIVDITYINLIVNVLQDDDGKTNGIVSPVGFMKVAKGTSQTLSFKPATNYKPTLTINGKSQAIQTNNGTLAGLYPLSYDLGALNVDTTVEVKFIRLTDDEKQDIKDNFGDDDKVIVDPDGNVTPNPDKYFDINIDAGDGGIVNPSHVQAQEGEDISFTIIPGPGKDMPENVTVYDTDENGNLIDADGNIIPDENGNPTSDPSKVVDPDKLVSEVVPVDPDTGTFVIEDIDSNKKVEVEFPDKVTSTGDYYNVTVDWQTVDQDGNVVDNKELGGRVSPPGVTIVPDRGSASFSIIPNTGYKVQIPAGSGYKSLEDVTEWRDLSGKSYWLSNITSDQSFLVQFVYDGNTNPIPLTTTIKATSSAFGLISPSGEVEVVDGGKQIFTFKPDAGYKLSYVVVDGSYVPAANIPNMQYTFDNVKISDAQHTIHAVFIPQDQAVEDFVSVTVPSPKGGTISPSGTILIKKGDSAGPFTVAPNVGYEFDGPKETAVSVTDLNGNPVPIEWNSDGTFTVPNVESNIIISANFKESTNSGNDELDEPGYTTITTTTDTTGRPEDEGAGGETSYPDVSTVEKVDPDEKVWISIAPDDEDGDENGSIVRDVVVKDEDGNIIDEWHWNYDDPDDPDNKILKDIYNNGGFEIDGDVVNDRVVIDVNFGKLTDEEQEDANNPDNGGLNKPVFLTLNPTVVGSGVMFPRNPIKVSAGHSQLITMIPENESFELTKFTIDGVDMMGELGKHALAGKEQGVNSRLYKLETTRDQAGTTIEAFAQFGIIQDKRPVYTVTANTAPSGGGEVWPSVTKVREGDSVKLTIIPDVGKAIKSITVKPENGDMQVNSGSAIRLKPTFTLPNIKDNYTVTVEFDDMTDDEKNQYPDGLVPEDQVCTVTVQPTEHGTVSPTETKCIIGEPQTFYFFPDDGYVASSVIINGVRTELSPGQLSFTFSPTGDTELIVEFIPADEAYGHVNITTSVTTDDGNRSTKVVVDDNEYGIDDCTVQPESQIINYGDSIDIYFYPAMGWTLESVTVNNRTIDMSDVHGLDDGDDSTNTVLTYDESAGKWNASTGASASASEGVVYMIYQMTLSDVTEDTEVVANMRPLDVERDGVDGSVIVIGHATKMLTVKVDGLGGTVSPDGAVKMPKGAQKTIYLNPYPNYALSSLLLQTFDDDGNLINAEDVTSRVQNGRYTVTVNENTVLTASFRLRDLVEAFNVGLGTVRIATYTEEALSAAYEVGEVPEPSGYETVSLSDVWFSKDVDVRGQLDADGWLLNESGSARDEFTSEGIPTFKIEYAGATQYEGFSWTIGNGDVSFDPSENGSNLQVISPNIALIRLLGSGKFNVDFKLVYGDPSAPDNFYSVTTEVVSGKGTVTPSGTSSWLSGTPFPVTFTPEGYNSDVADRNDEHWMLGEVRYTKVDDEGNPVKDDDGAEHWTSVTPDELSEDGKLMWTLASVDADYLIQVTFDEAAWLGLQWNTDEMGYVSPNHATNDYLVTSKGSAIPFAIAPYEKHVVKEVVFEDSNGALTHTGTLVQSSAAAQQLVDKYGLKYNSLTNGAGLLGSKTNGSDDGDDNGGNGNRPSNETNAVATSSLSDAKAPKSNTNAETVYQYMTPSLEDPYQTLRVVFDTNDATDPDIDPSKLYTLTASVDGTGGRVTPPEYTNVPEGEERTFAFTPDSGYSVSQISIDDGAWENYTSNSYKFENVKGNSSLKVRFASSSAAPDSPADQLGKGLSTFARTGDLNKILLVGLLLIAAVALGIVGYTKVRRNRRQA